jgi:PAS domain S-box-containing protein
MLLHAFFFIIVGHISVFLHFFIFPDIEFLHWLYYSSIIAYILSLEVILLSFIITASFKSLLYTQLSLFGLIFILATFGIFSAIDLLFIISINIVTLIVFVTAFYLLYKTREQVILIFIFAMLITTLGSIIDIGSDSNPASYIGRIGGYLFLITLILIPIKSDNKYTLADLFQIRNQLDITKQKLANTEKQYRTLVEKANFGIITLRDNEVLFTNNKFHLLYGNSESEQITFQKLKKIFTEFPKNFEIEGTITNSVRSSGVLQFETGLKRIKGKALPVEVTLNKIIYLGKPAVMIFVQDISERSRLRDGLINSKKESEFYTDILSHDLLNYNQAVNGMLELAMRENNLQDSTRSILTSAMKHVSDSSKLIMNVRKFNRIKDGSHKFKDVDVKEVLKKCVEDAKLSNRKENLKFNLNFSDEVRIVKGDELLPELFSNLITNAVKYDEHNEKIIDLVLTDGNRGGLETCKVQIIDRGIGISDIDKEKIFNRFNRIKRSKDGTGLGLSIAKEIVAKYNGRIWVEDRIPHDYKSGSVFNVELLR